MDLSLISNPVHDEDEHNANTTSSTIASNAGSNRHGFERADSQPRLSIHNLMNNESDNDSSTHTILPPINANVSPKGMAPQPHISTMSQIKSRSSIISLTNEDDIDMDGKHVPNASRKLSVTSNTSLSGGVPTPVMSLNQSPPVDLVKEEEVIKMDGKSSTPQVQGEEHLQENKVEEMDVDSAEKQVKAEIKGSETEKSKEVKETKKKEKKEPKKREKKTKEFVEPKAPLKKEKSEEKEDTKIDNNDREYIDEPGKPRRYFQIPIWAQDYEPHSSASKSGNSTSNGNSEDSKPSSLLMFPSITGSVPRNDMNKIITDWIWANLEGVKYDYKDVLDVTNYIELELKLGNIWEKAKDRRLQLPVNTETIISIDYFHTECFFKSGIPLQHFHDIKVYLSQISELANARYAEMTNNQNNKQFFTSNSHVTDLITSGLKRNDKPVTNRVSLDVKTKRVTESIKKQRVADLFIYQPNSLYDLRLSMSLELPMELNDTLFENFKKKVNLEREKERVSFVHQSTFTKIDITKVRELHVGNPGTGPKRSEPKYELELELNTPELLKSIAKVIDEPLYYCDLVQGFLDNGRIISRQISLNH